MVLIRGNCSQNVSEGHSISAYNNYNKHQKASVAMFLKHNQP